MGHFLDGAPCQVSGLTDGLGGLKRRAWTLPSTLSLLVSLSL